MRRISLALCFSLPVTWIGGLAQALPEQAGTAAGAVSLETPAADALHIRQHTPRAMAEWKRFDIGRQETVRVFQPSENSVLLNRVLETDPTEILGRLEANGHVWILNPGGVLFGEGARVDVGGLLATTAGISDADFLSGHYDFSTPGQAGASIVNRGEISADGGMVGLLAPQVANHGIIRAHLGKVSLAATETFTVDFHGDGLFHFALEDLDEDTVRSERYGVLNTGNVIADAGQVEMTVAEGNAVIERRLEHRWGILQADSVGRDREGRVVLGGGAGAATFVSGAISAQGQEAGEHGGSIEILGDRVRLLDGATVDASGPAGGGSVHVGGEYLGGGDTHRDQLTTIAPSVRLAADATHSGDGGEVIVWSEQATRMDGQITARGVEEGGFVETSSRGRLGVRGQVDASTASGAGGLWLLDPSNVTIERPGGNNVAGAGGTENPSTDGYSIDADSIETALDAGNSVTITTTNGGGTEDGDITVNDAIAKTAGGAATLKLEADNSIFVNNDITSTSGTLNVTLHSDADDSGFGSVRLLNSTIDTNGGAVIIGGGADPALNPARGTAANDDGVEIDNSTLSTGAGSISIRGRGEAAGADNYGVYIHTGSVLQSTSGSIDVTGIGGNGTDNNHGVYLANAGTEITTADGDIDITGTANGTGNSNYGIYLSNGADIVSTGIGAGAGNITFDGTGSNGAASANIGIMLQHGGTLVSTVDGDILMTGEGGTSHSTNIGVYLTGGGSIASTGTGAEAGNITLDGTAHGSGSWTTGVALQALGVATSITAVDGDISLTGIGAGGAGGIENWGVSVNESTVSTTGIGAGAGNISLTGTGGAGTGGVNHGVYVFNTGGVTAAGPGTITLTGTAGATSGSDIISDTGANLIGGAAAGDMTLTGNTMSFANLTASSAEDIILQTRTAATTVGLAGGAGTLNLTTAELNLFNPGGAFILGAVDSGNMTVDARDWGGEDVQFRSGGGGVINVAGAQTNIGDLTITTDADAAIAAGVAGTGTLTLQPVSNATTLGLAGAAGAVNFSAADLANLGIGWTEWLVGSTTGTGAVSVGAHSWADPVTFRSAAGGSTAIVGNQQITAASDGSFTFTGPVTLSADIDTTNGAGAAQNLTFPAAVTLAGDSHLDVGAGDIQFTGAVDGGFALELTTSNDITFDDDVGAGTRLGAVTVDPRHFTAGAFNAASFNLTGGTGNVTFNGTGLNTTGDIGITTNGNISGTMQGDDGVLDAGAGAITLTSSFATLDITGASATLLAGYIGAPGAATPTMANLISIDGLRNPWGAGIPSPDFTFAGFQIGANVAPPGGGAPPPVPQPPAPPVTPPPAPSPVTPPPQSPPAPPVEPGVLNETETVNPEVHLPVDGEYGEFQIPEIGEFHDFADGIFNLDPGIGSSYVFDGLIPGNAVVFDEGGYTFIGRDYVPAVGDYIFTGAEFGFEFMFDENSIIKMTRNSELRVRKVLFSPDGKESQYIDVQKGAAGFFSDRNKHKGEIKTILPGVAIKVTGTCYIVDYDEETERTNITLFGGGIELYIKDQLIKLKHPIQKISFNAKSKDAAPITPVKLSMDDVRQQFQNQPEVIPSREQLLKCGVPEKDM